VIDKDSARTNDTEKDLTNSLCRGAISRFRYTNVERTSTWLITKIYASVSR